MIIDSHCHLNLLDLSPYNGNVEAVIEEARLSGVETLLCVGIDLTHAQEVIDLAEAFDNVYASVGVHPSEEEPTPAVETLIEWASHPKVVAIGETGLDYYYNKDGLEEMRERFRIHIQAARILQKPLIIHTRDAREDTIDILREEKAETIGGVMHCFTESLEMALAAIELGFYISFSGIVTFKNATELANVARNVPLDRILIETDAPYLTPIPFRGKPNTPKYVRYVAEKIAELKGLSFDEVAHATTTNFHKLFLKG